MAQSARSASVYFGKNVNRTRRRGMIRGAVRVIVLLVIVGIVLTPFISVSSIPSKAIPTSASIAWRGLRSLRWITIPALFRKTSMWQSALKTAS